MLSEYAHIAKQPMLLAYECTELETLRLIVQF